MTLKRHGTDTASANLRDQVRATLGAWDDPDKLAHSPLLTLAIVDRQRRTRGYSDTLHGKSRALKEVLIQAIEELRPATGEDGPDQNDKRWRPYIIVVERFLQDRNPNYLQGYLSIGHAVFNEEQAKGLSRVANLLEEWEEACRVAQAQVALQEPTPQPNSWSYDQELACFFTAADELQTLFKHLVGVAAPLREKRLLVIHGIGGIGKSSLLRMFRLHCLERSIPVGLASAGDLVSLVSLLENWAVALESTGISLPLFKQMLRQYHQLCRRLGPPSSAFQMGTTHTSIKGTEQMVHVMKSDVQGGESSRTLRKIGVESETSWLPASFSKAEVGLIHDPERVLTDCFVQEVEQAANTRQVVLLLDTFERWSTYEEQIRNIIQRMPNTLFVIAGRVAPDWSISWSGQASLHELKEMNEADVQTLVHRYYAMLRSDMPAPSQVEAIVRFAHGLPLAVTTAVRLWVKHALDFETIEPAALADTVDCLVAGVPARLRPLLEAAAVLRWFNRGVLRAVAGTEAIEVYDEMRRFPFVRPHKHVYALHDIVRQILGDHLRKHDPQQYRELHARAAHYFSQQIEQEEGDEHDRSRFESLYHSICAHEQRGMALLQGYAEEMVRLQFTHRLRSLLNDANSYPLFRPESREWLKFYEAELAHLELKFEEAEQIYQGIVRREVVDSKLVGYVLSGLAGIYQKPRYVSQPKGLQQVTEVIERSVTLLPQDDLRVARNWLWLGGALAVFGQIDDERNCYERARTHCERTEDQQGVTAAQGTIVRMYARTGDWVSMSSSWQERQHKPSTTSTITQMYNAYADQAINGGDPWIAWTTMGRYREAESLLSKLLATKEQVGETECICPLLRNLTFTLGVQDRFDEAYACGEQALQLTRRLYGREATTTLIFLGHVLCRHGQYAEGEQSLRKGLQLNKHENYLLGYVDGLVWLGQLFEVSNDLEQAEKYYQEALDYAWINRRYYTCSALTGLVRVKYAQGMIDAMGAFQRQAEQLAQQYEYNDHLASLRLTQGHHAWDRGDSPLSYYRHALIYALRYNRFLLDEVLSGRVYGTQLLPIVSRCLAQGAEGQQLLADLNIWWQTGVNEVNPLRSATVSPIPEGMRLTEAEHMAREREHGNGLNQKPVAAQLELTRS